MMALLNDLISLFFFIAVDAVAIVHASFHVFSIRHFSQGHHYDFINSKIPSISTPKPKKKSMG
jgi:hypothetical protein